MIASWVGVCRRGNGRRTRKTLVINPSLPIIPSRAICPLSSLFLSIHTHTSFGIIISHLFFSRSFSSLIFASLLHLHLPSPSPLSATSSPSSELLPRLQLLVCAFPGLFCPSFSFLRSRRCNTSCSSRPVPTSSHHLCSSGPPLLSPLSPSSSSSAGPLPLPLSLPLSHPLCIALSCPSLLPPRSLNTF
jgi:hypothetical protein